MLIVSPWIVYLINTADSIGVLLMTFCSLSAGSVIISIIYFMYLKDVGRCPSKIRIFVASVIFVVLSIITTLFPNKNTLMQMAVASQVTVERVDIEKEIVEKIYNDIIEIIKEK